MTSNALTADLKNPSDNASDAISDSLDTPKAEETLEVLSKNIADLHRSISFFAQRILKQGKFVLFIDHQRGLAQREREFVAISSSVESLSGRDIPTEDLLRELKEINGIFTEVRAAFEKAE